MILNLVNYANLNDKMLQIHPHLKLNLKCTSQIKFYCFTLFSIKNNIYASIISSVVIVVFHSISARSSWPIILSKIFDLVIIIKA